MRKISGIMKGAKNSAKTEDHINLTGKIKSDLFNHSHYNAFFLYLNDENISKME